MIQERIIKKTHPGGKFIAEATIETFKDVALVFGIIVLLFLVMPIGLIKLFSVWFEPDIAIQLFMVVHILVIVFVMLKHICKL